MLINLIGDYGIGDPAFAEVSQRLNQKLPAAQIYCLSVPPFSTLATGFWIAQLGLNPGASDRLIYHNCAPRQDNLEARPDNEGEGLTYVKLANGVQIVGVLAGYTLSFVKEEALQINNINVSRGGSQFRSRDVFPQAAAAIAMEDYSLLGDAIAPAAIPDPPADRVAWSDGYGNIKTTIPASSVDLPQSSKVVVRVGDVVSDAIYSDGSFRVPEGTLAFAPGSSGWQKKDGTKVTWMELFLRGGNAWERFAKPKVNRPISYSKS
ncbi:S-adenosyl-l-methionine hydroxide adenosyltransferase family protein [Myxosarcina sp. GI1]|uniref:SAM hydrolase/SAM-dependent halogenase family protein n=1 Tax=Myxosarcina sp. GI1 TaxID=1541065 RepID=UPI0005601B7E|nr:SAM-dependent chlorinase/fluorinase [Myxosarcina sp. GI1]